MYKIILFLSLTGILPTMLHTASSSHDAGNVGDLFDPADREISSLQDLTKQVLVGYPEKIVQAYDRLSNAGLQTLLFVESIGHALSKRLGFSVLSMNPDMPFVSRVFKGEVISGFSPDGTFLALSSRADNVRDNIHVYNLVTKKKIGIFRDEKNPIFSPDGTLFASIQHYTHGQHETEIRLRASATGKLIRTFICDSPGWLHFNIDGTVLAVVSSTSHSQISLYTIATGQLVHTFKGEMLTFCPNRNLLVPEIIYDNLGPDDKMSVRHATTGQMITSYKGEAFPVFSHDGTLFACQAWNDKTGAYDDIRLRSIANKQLIALFEGESRPLFSPNGKILASSTMDDVLRLRDVATLRIMHESKDLRERVFSPDSTMLAGVSRNHSTRQNEIYVQNAMTGQVMYMFEGNYPKFSPDGTLLASSPLYVVRGFGGGLSLRNALSGEPIVMLHEESSPVFSPDGSILASRLGDNTILREVDFCPDLQTVIDADEHLLLLAAAHAWQKKKAYTIDADNPVFVRSLKKMPYLSHKVLFDVQPADHTVPTSSSY